MARPQKPPNHKCQKVHIYLPPPLKAWLQQEATRHGRPLSGEIAFILNQYHQSLLSLSPRSASESTSSSGTPSSQSGNLLLANETKAFDGLRHRVGFGRSLSGSKGEVT